jgi:hypothetical protein
MQPTKHDISTLVDIPLDVDDLELENSQETANTALETFSLRDLVFVFLLVIVIPALV